MVAEIGENGSSLSDVARRYGVHSSVVGRWYARYGKDSGASPSFIPVTVAAPETAPAVPPEPVSVVRAEAVIEVILANGRRLVVAEAIAPSRLRQLIGAVEAA